MNTPFNAAVNDQKQLAFISSTNAGHNRLMFMGASGELQLLGYFNGSGPYTTAIATGGTFNNLAELAINEAGIVVANVTANGAQGGLFLFDGAAWQTLCQLQNCTFDGEAVTSISQLKSAGNSFCAVFNNRLQLASIRCWQDGAWTTAMKRGEITSDGTELNSIGTFDVNRNGDVAAVLFTQGLGGPSIFVKRGDQYTTVNAALFPLDKTTFRNVYSLDLRDDGRLFFSAMDFNDRIILYAADPR